ncbi:MAG: DCC1-like thiol-disulfide oxidoreductase family protein [Terracidiphilus sp.]
MKLKAWMFADEASTDGRGWSANLDIFRVAFIGLAVLPWAIRNLIWICEVMPGLPRSVWIPISFYRWLPFALLSSVGLAKTLAAVNIACILLGLIGFGTRKALACSAVFSLYLFGLTENQGKVDHMHHLIWFTALLAAGPAGRFLSIDSLRRALRNADARVMAGPKLPFDALWTLRYVWLLLGLLYLIPGLAKLDRALLAHWTSASNLDNVFWRKWLEVSLFGIPSTPPIRIDLWPTWFIELAGAGVIAFEIGFLFVVLFRRLRAPAIFAGLGFHIGNGIILQIWFTTLFPVYVALVDWCALGRRMCRAGERRFIIIYDGQCRFCRRTVSVLKSMDLFDAVQLKPIESFSVETGEDQSAGISTEVRARDLHVIYGDETVAGYDAYVAIARRIALLWPVAIVMRWSFVAARGRRIYRKIADSRHCSIEPAAATGHENERPKRLVLVVGTGLAVAQFLISFVMYAYTELPGKVAKLPAFARKTIVHVGRAQPVWPFNYYPTFSYGTGGEADLWEARWIVDGREVRVSSQAYENAFHNSGTVWNIATDPQNKAPERSLELVRTLWRTESPDIKQSVSGVKIYWTSYRLGPASQAPGALESASLLFTFPKEDFSQ